MEQILKALADINTYLDGAPVYVVTCLGCLIVGYALRAAKRFPNDAIPLCVIGAGGLIYLLMAPVADGQTLRGWVVKSIVCGMFWGLVTWLAHNVIISKVEEFAVARFPILRGLLGQPAAETKPQTVTPEAAQPKKEEPK